MNRYSKFELKAPLQELFYYVNFNMRMLILIIVVNFLGAQDFYWEQINSVPEGYQYVMGSNDSGEMVVAGVEFNDNYPMQLHYRNSKGVWIQIPGNGLA